ncbi:helix-turn-helix domain-containing protein [Flavobacterium gawalongense]|uniref:Helix-turn-helix transcriptional regulator n=1 Tax=Flavobacterium gawalongense TaxID=2594432 RepID=A0A553BN06_9FLAO|nr:helix-turn-helix transcriptional regulator [Flavobacterium gawalongense]TRW95859.1 helix-turn-helix transcriptional regulator [Flavobacterium gawalongense]TRX00450.1 helix-turn-helix transcriptional regulator [Flavobacterium gawalongense]TRX09637.1 helix-turn-helix transcriptional regulator [Flavobacterium gawalongense]TRX09645.1 helix-turn-helix transcriptional regulator [Flavobacterium gawalongense]TRX10863.1 helix-turn-helix transcriptional regulator [Flavobacterium gawalongense]
MNIGEKIRQIREAKGLSQKEVALTLVMNPSQYSKIENGKVDPQFSSIERIANALGVDIVDIFNSDKIITDIDSFDKTLVEKIQLMEQLEENQRKSIFSIIDMAIYNIKLKQTLSSALAL